MEKFSYKSRLFFYFFIVFAIFTLTVVIYQQSREKQYKRQLIEEQLDIYCNIAYLNHFDTSLPENIRITVIDEGGKVLFDTRMDSVALLENHFNRPEIIGAKIKGVGSDIRLSQSVGIPFIYYAKKTENGFIRTALPYDVEMKDFLHAENSFLIISTSLFLVSLFFLWRIADRFGRDVIRLQADVVSEQKARIGLKSEMTNSIAHELRTPVSAIRGYIETLLEEDLSPETRRNFTVRAYDAAVRLSDLVRDVALITKLEEAENLFKKEEVDVYEIVGGIIEEFTTKINENSVKIENLVPKYLIVTGNQTLLYSIFRNLIENALKYAGKWITIKIELTGEDDNFYYFSVSDTGPGIDDQFAERIFERFFRINDGRSREDGGSGLGLSIVRHAVMYHGGKVSAQNQPNSGLKVLFSLKR